MKRIFSFILALMLLCGMLPQLGIQTRAVSYIEDQTQVDGSDYTTVYAEKLNMILRGEVELFSNSAVKYALGDSMKTNTSYSVAGVISGYQCYIYSQAVYYHLFGDVVYHGNGYKYWSDSVKVLTNKKTVSYEMFTEAQVGFGAYIRTTPNSNGSYNSADGHSMIVLAYDPDGITYLEGNADGRGLIRITQMTWSEFNSNNLTSRGRRICHIVQCKSAMCEHAEYTELGDCTKCGEAFDFAATMNAEAAGLYAVTAAGGAAVRANMPYDAAQEAFLAEEELRLDVLGSVYNAYGETWYQVSYKGKQGYTREENLMLDTVTPGEPVLKYTAEPVDNKPTAFTWADTANTTHYELLIEVKNAQEQWESYEQLAEAVSGVSRELPVGEYRVSLRACNSDEPQPDASGCLYTEAEPAYLTVSHAHIYIALIITPASCTAEGTQQLTCQSCGNTASEQIPVTDHSYVDHYCTHCDAKEPSVVKLTVAAKESTGKPALSWNKVSGAKKYEVYRATAENGKYTRVKTTTKTSYTDTKATAGKQYFYKVKVQSSKSAYNGKYSWVISCWAACARPSVTAKSDAATGKPGLSWKAVTGAESYQIFRRLPGEEAFVFIGECTGKSYLDAAAEVDTKYEYRVQAMGASSEADSAVSATVQAVAVCARPVVKTDVTENGKPVISWNTVEGAVEYKVYRATKATNSMKYYTYKATVTELSFEDASASGGKTYYYKVIAVGENSSSAYSTYKKALGKCAIPQVEVQSNSKNYPVLKWGKVTGAKKYEIQYSVDGSAFKKLTTTTKTSYTHSGAKGGSSYVYKVRALGSSSGYHSQFSPELSCDVRCAAPSVTVKTDKTTGQPVLSWKKVTGAVCYEIYRSISGGEYALLDTCTAYSYKDADVQAGISYSYKVVALGKGEQFHSGESKAASVTAKCAQPKLSGKLDENGKPVLTWDAVEDADTYVVYRASSKNGKKTKIGTTAEQLFNYAKAAKGKNYYYTVIALCNDTESAHSNTVKLKAKK